MKNTDPSPRPQEAAKHLPPQAVRAARQAFGHNMDAEFPGDYKHPEEVFKTAEKIHAEYLPKLEAIREQRNRTERERDEARTSLERLAGALKEKDETLAQVNEVSKRIEAKVNRMKANVETMGARLIVARAALKNYGRHASTCPKAARVVDYRASSPCNCGYSDSLKRAGIE